MPRTTCLVTLLYLLTLAAPLPAWGDVGVQARPGAAEIHNGAVRLVYHLDEGAYEVRERASGKVLLGKTAVRLNSWESTAPAYTHRYEQHSIEDALGQGEVLRIISSAAALPTLLFEVAAYDNHPALAFQAGVFNTTAGAVTLKEIAVIDGGMAWPGTVFGGDFTMLDGRAGGQYTGVVRGDYMHSMNNAMATHLDGSPRRTLVLGGLTYHDYEKAVTLGKRLPRHEQIEAMAGQSRDTLAYLNLGDAFSKASASGPALGVTQGRKWVFTAPAAEEYTHIVFDPAEVVIEATGLDPAKHYELGFTWFDSRPVRVQSVYVDNGNGGEAEAILTKEPVPAIIANQKPEQVRFSPARQHYPEGRLRLRFAREDGPNAIVSEVWVREVKAPVPLERVHLGLASDKPPRDLPVWLRASDPMGMPVAPGETYMPADRFYADFAASDPFEALERYGHALRKAQDIQLDYYDFPTVCLWYAMHPYYGDGPSVNDSPGAVAEMQRIADAGFLRYSRAAVRLVPDNYGVNNEQGWWDDAHWQRYGSGVNPHNVVVEGGHLKAPHETTVKWGSAVRELGGIPLIYFQTGYVSRDFQEAHPEYLLGNDSNRSYDFTDPGFLRHMRRVYLNLRSGGIQGLMFDYPDSGWAVEGGFEQPATTVAAAYRTIFDLPNTLLGKESYVHERDLSRGSDISLGVIDSERIWGDTDLITPPMVMRGALRWYKNRVAVSYDMDSKNLLRAAEQGRDGVRAMLTMCYVAGGRFLLGNSFAKMNSEMVHDLSRTFPYHVAPRSARPADAFVRAMPSVFDFEVDADWHQVTLYNTRSDEPMALTVPLAGDSFSTGALGLRSDAAYWAYDFWNGRLAARLGAGEMLEQTLRPGEARMLSFRRVKARPQVISSDRHIMQGMLELGEIRWLSDEGALTGTASVIAGEPLGLVIAPNGYRAEACQATPGQCSLEAEGEDGLIRLVVKHKTGGMVRWTVRFSK